MKILLCLLFLSVSSAWGATKYNPFTGKLDYIGSASASASLPLPQGATNYIQNTDSLQSGATLYVSSGTVSFLNVGVIKATGPVSASQTGVSNNITKGLIDIYKNDASAGDVLFSVGSNQQGDQFLIRDQFPLFMGVYGVRAGTLNIGLNSFSDKIMSANTIDQHINFWNSGDIDIQTGLAADAAKDIVLKPRTIEALRISNATGITAISSMTVTASDGVGVTYGVIVGSITINTGGSANQTVCWKTSTTLGYCSSVVGVLGACTCN